MQVNIPVLFDVATAKDQLQAAVTFSADAWHATCNEYYLRYGLSK